MTLVNAHSKYSRGFTLIEMLVATGLFLAVLTIVVGAIISIQYGAKKARNMRIAMDNINMALESISRDIRTGTTIHCDRGITPITTWRNCPRTDADGNGGADSIALEAQGGDAFSSGDQHVYRLCGGRIERSKTGDPGGSIPCGTLPFSPITAPEISVELLNFQVHGAEIDRNQPFVRIMIRGTIGTSPKDRATFTVQTFVTPRAPNISY